MSYKYFTPKSNRDPWESYWSKADIKKEVETCKTDELLEVIDKFVSKKDKIIEAGCGLGRWVIYFKTRGYDIIGVDNYANAIKRLRKYDSGLKLKVADIEKLPFKKESFDVYLSFGVVEHVEEGPEKALLEAKRILKKGGIIILETPHDSFLRRVKRKVGRIKKKKEKNIKLQFYEYRFEGGELKKFLRKTGFKVVGEWPKDIDMVEESIGLWSDFPFLRESEVPFKLNLIGRMVKVVLLPFKKLFSGCYIVVGRKK